MHNEIKLYNKSYSSGQNAGKVTYILFFIPSAKATTNVERKFLSSLK